MRFIAVILFSVALLAGALHLVHVEPTAEAPTFAGTLRLAFAGDLTGSGRESLRTLGILASDINATGGIDGLQLDIVPFDDHGGPVGARRVANLIAEDDSILAVIGHTASATSTAAAPIYASAGIPAVSPSATHDELTRTNPWYFRTVHSDGLQATFLGDYALKALAASGVAVVRTPLAQTTPLPGLFRAALAKDGPPLRYETMANPAAPSFTREIAELTEAIRALPPDLVIVLLAREEQGVALVQAIRDAGLTNRILGPDWLGSERFGQALAQLPREQHHPGLYTGRLMVVAPFLPDIASREANQLLARYDEQYGPLRNWSALYAYDAGRVIVAAIQRAGLSKRWSTRVSARRLVRDQLDAVRSALHAVPGVTGPLYFNDDGTPDRAMAVGQFHNGLVAALTQIRYGGPTATDGGDGRRDVRTTAVAQVGLAAGRISDIDPAQRTARVEFDLWFRQRSQPGPAAGAPGPDALTDIVFINAAEPVGLGAPVEQGTRDGEEYRLFHVSARFHMDEPEGQSRRTIGGHHISVRFHHRNLPYERLVYAPERDGGSDQDLANALTTRKIAGSDWVVTDASLRADVAASLPGSSLRSGERRDGREMSTIRFDLDMAPRDQGLRRQLHGAPALAAALLLSLLLLALRAGERWTESRHWPRMMLLTDTVLTGLAMLAAESALLDSIARFGTDQPMAMVVTLFDVLWWLVPAIVVNQALHRFIWDPLEESSERAIPQVVKSTATLLIMLLAVLGIIAHVFQKDLTSLLATSGVLAMIIGLSLQSNLSNIFSGMVLNLERPFRRGDWIKVGDAPMGQVIDISWRSTKIQSFNNSVISIPNALAAGARIENCSHPNGTFFAQMLLHVTPGHEPERIVNLLSDAMRLVRSVDGRKHLGLVWVKFNGIDEFGMRFFIAFDLTDRGLLQSQEHAVLLSIHAVLKRAGITLSQRQANIRLVDGTTDLVDQRPDAAVLIAAAPLFQPLTPAARDRLAANARPRRCLPGDTIFAQGQPGRSLFLVAEGIVLLNTPGPEGKDVELSRLGPGALFGEVALLTGDVRTTTARAWGPVLLYEVDEVHLAQVLGEDPALLEVLGRIASAQSPEIRGQELNGEDDTQRRRAGSVMSRIRGAFGFNDAAVGP
ncbi:ABC transporter substrate-binding protein [Azospirillum sp. TSO35-2]|uniref:ABC transporter substrate-binding protein n=1 Tax=Azospirillum sp. TSO35-2 TaxID=716796 RepID=UPI000D619D26|nr:ABC transporter substrate-binding protein [Azospirillum sp. TSO35-2]PWC31256.1 hypothetical protein TSO352_31180 [Azospirillum sp. TSO35-2]